MPQPRKYATRADQQAAYRNRRVIADQELLAAEGVAALTGDPYDAGQCALERDDRPGASATLGGRRRNADLP